VAGKVFCNISLDAEADRDIIRWLDAQPNRSAAMRDAARSYLGRAGVTVADVLQAVHDLERKVKAGGVVVQDAEAGGSDEPPDVAAALDALADL
jgi:hypothetical protein